MPPVKGSVPKLYLNLIKSIIPLQIYKKYRKQKNGVNPTVTQSSKSKCGKLYKSNQPIQCLPELSCKEKGRARGEYGVGGGSSWKIERDLKDAHVF